MSDIARAVLMICDGMRADFVQPELCPHICDLQREGTHFAAHRSVFPSVTRTSSASIATGRHPGDHGLHGNTMALATRGGYSVHNVGNPSYVETMRTALGRTLIEPTLAQRLSGRGNQVLFSNVSPGAAYFHDPDGYGHVYHRAGSVGPGRRPVQDPLLVSHDAEGDLEMTSRFCHEVLLERKPTLAVLWLANPDQAMHVSGLGSPEHLRALQSVDACVKRVNDTVARIRESGEEILFAVGSDHGQETVRRVIPVERMMVDAGFKKGLDPNAIVVAPQGTSALIYCAETVERSRVSDIGAWLRERDWCGEVWVDESLNEIGLNRLGGIRLALSMAKSDEPNAFGIPGLSDAVVRFDCDEETPGLGQHGGVGRFEQSPFLTVIGRGFEAGSVVHAPSSILDIAPTLIAHLGLKHEPLLPGRRLQGEQNHV